MAEALGLAASIAGVAGFTSLALQLGQGLLKLEQLHRKLRDAPEMLNHAILSIMAIEMQLQMLRSYTATSSSYSREKAMLDAPLELCGRSIRKMNGVIDDIERKWKRTERFGRLAAVMKDKEMRELLLQLDREQTMLSLAVQYYAEANANAHRTVTTRNFQLVCERLDRIESQTALHDRSASPQQDAVQTYGQSTDLATVHNKDLSRPLAKESKRAKSSRLVLRFHPWFFQRVFTLTATQATQGWDVLLRTYNVVPDGAAIFTACASGDLVTVQTLIAEGRASPLDRDQRGLGTLEVGYNIFAQDTKLLLILLQYASVAALVSPALVRFLLMSTKFPDADLVISSCLWRIHSLITQHMIYCSAHTDAILLETLDRHVGNSDFDLEWALTTPDESHFRDWAFITPRCHELVAQSTGTPWTDAHTREERFKMAITAAHWASRSPYQLLSICGVMEPDSWLAAMDVEGRSLLHVAARHFGTCSIKSPRHYGSSMRNRFLSEWRDLVFQLIVLGADLHKVSDIGDSTPLMACLKAYLRETNDFRDWRGAVVILQAWTEILQAAGVDLEVYGRKEQLSWQDGIVVDFPHSESSMVADSLVYGHAPKDWDAIIRYKYDILIREDVASSLPGSWTQNAHTVVPQTICWRPREKDGSWDDWVEKRSVCLMGAPIRLTALAAKRSGMMAVREDPSYRRLNRSLDDQCMITTFAVREGLQLLTGKTRANSVPSLPRRRQAHDIYRVSEARKHHPWLSEATYIWDDREWDTPEDVCRVSDADELDERGRLRGYWCNDVALLRLAWPTWPEWQQFIEARAEGDDVHHQTEREGPLRTVGLWQEGHQFQGSRHGCPRCNEVA
ncbi:hypothetical protein LTR53_007199 [Teratosphaeriaceae sp. CCFEE 6253]|nr:hypothetical protein LTR53_007199 [Teratosphaeriaceae sp. CCFEE 6253]